MKDNKGIIIIAGIIVFILIIIAIIIPKGGKDVSNTTDNDTFNTEVEPAVKQSINGLLTGATNSINPLKDCYSNILSDSNYQENIKEAMAMFMKYTNGNGYTLNKPYDLPNCKEECQSVLSKNENNYLIDYNNATLLLQRYGITDEPNKYFTSLTDYENEYYIIEITDEINSLKCNYKIDHNIEMKYISANEIEVIDNQTVKKYDEIIYHEGADNEYKNELESTGREVTYIVEKNAELIMLKSVTVK